MIQGKKTVCMFCLGNSKTSLKNIAKHSSSFLPGPFLISLYVELKIAKEYLGWLENRLEQLLLTQWRVRVGWAVEMKALPLLWPHVISVLPPFYAELKQALSYPDLCSQPSLFGGCSQLNNKRASLEGTVSTTREEKGKMKALGPTWRTQVLHFASSFRSAPFVLALE